MIIMFVTIDRLVRLDQHSYPRGSPTVKWTFIKKWKNDDDTMMMNKFEMVLNKCFFLFL